jgi:hypothetical protein
LVGDKELKKLMEFAKRTNKAPEMKNLLKMQLDEDYEEETYVANRLQKTLFLDFKKFKEDCKYDNVWRKIELEIENNRIRYKMIYAWGDSLVLLEACWNLARNWQSYVNVLYNSRIRIFWDMYNNDLVKEWMKINMDRNCDIKMNALKQIVAGEIIKREEQKTIDTRMKIVIARVNKIWKQPVTEKDLLEVVEECVGNPGDFKIESKNIVPLWREHITNILFSQGQKLIHEFYSNLLPCTANRPKHYAI